MSLSSALDDHDGPVAAFLRERFPCVRPTQRAFRERVAARETIRPDPPAGLGVPWGTIGTAIDYRLRYYFASYPLARTVAFHGLAVLSDSAVVAVLTRAFGDGARQLKPDRWSRLFEDFSSSLKAGLAVSKPVGRRLPDLDEDALNRHCWVLALLEQLYRAGMGINSPLFHLPQDADLSDLLALGEPWLEDMRLLSRAFFGECRRLLPQPHVLNPKFAGSSLIGGADADMVVGDCLIEVKTTVEPGLPSRTLHQLLGYVLLDFDDRFRLGQVAIYMSRQGVLVRWPLRELLETLADAPVDLAAARRDFELAVRAADLQVDLDAVLVAKRLALNGGSGPDHMLPVRPSREARASKRPSGQRGTPPHPVPLDTRQGPG